MTIEAINKAERRPSSPQEYIVAHGPFTRLEQVPLIYADSTSIVWPQVQSRAFAPSLAEELEAWEAASDEVWNRLEEAE